MKSTLLFLGALTLPIAASAQITVTEADVAVPTDLIIQTNDTLPAVSMPSTGANQTWDYTAATPHFDDTLNFSSPSWMMHSSFFPTSNIGILTGGAEFFMYKDATTFGSLGLAADFFGTGTEAIKIDPMDEFIRFPANFNDSYTTSSIQKFSFPGSVVGAPADSIVNKSYKSKDVTIDGWGSITTPLGTFDVLLQSEVITTTDSTWMYNFGIETLVDDSEEITSSASFWANSMKFPVATIEADDMGTVTGFSWLKEQPSAEISSQENIESQAYPNPASDEITITFSQNVHSVKVISVTGQEVMNVTNNSSMVQLDVSGLKNGVYFYQAVDAQNKELATRRFVVKK